MANPIIFILVTFLVFCARIIWRRRKRKHPLLENAPEALFAAGGMALFVSLITAVVLVVLYFSTRSYSYWGPFAQNIASITREDRISGSFTLGSGNVSGRDYFYFYTKSDTDSNEYWLGRAPALGLSVIETQKWFPCVVYRYEGEDNLITRWAYGKNLALQPENEIDKWRIYDTIFVPPNTIIKQFELK